MVVGWHFCVATWHNGHFYQMSPLFISKMGAVSEYIQMGNSMNLHVLQGKAWIYRHAYKATFEEEDMMDEGAMVQEPNRKQRKMG